MFIVLTKQGNLRDSKAPSCVFQWITVKLFVTEGKGCVYISSTSLKDHFIVTFGLFVGYVYNKNNIYH